MPNVFLQNPVRYSRHYVVLLPLRGSSLAVITTLSDGIINSVGEPQVVNILNKIS